LIVDGRREDTKTKKTDLWHKVNTISSKTESIQNTNSIKGCFMGRAWVEYG